MGDFDDLIDDAENFHGEELAEEDVDDYFVAEHKIAVTAKKRAVDDENDDNCHSASSIGKKAKIPGCLADYFIDTAEPFQSNGQQSSNTSSIEQKVVYTADSAITKQNASQNSDDDGINFGEKRPLCFCGISSMSKTTLKEGQNKNRMFWVRISPHRSHAITSFLH